MGLDARAGVQAVTLPPLFEFFNTSPSGKQAENARSSSNVTGSLGQEWEVGKGAVGVDARRKAARRLKRQPRSSHTNLKTRRSIVAVKSEISVFTRGGYEGGGKGE